MRKQIIKALFGFNADDLRSNNAKIAELQDALGQFKDDEASYSQLVQEKLSRITDLGDAAFNILKAGRDNTESLRNRLWEVRKTDEYDKVFTNKTPLVSVRIATFNNADKLINVAIKSVLNQTYKNIEIIVVGDNCTDDTAEKIAALNDSRITFVNFPYRSVYPEDAHNRWLVAGSPGMNLGAYLAKGEWIAPLDDDDEFSEDHIEKLLDVALKNKAEFAYGAIMHKNTVTQETKVLFSDPPRFGEFSFQSVMYMKQLVFFEYDQQSWVVGEPGDWNLCRRMLLCGVRIASTKDVVTTLHMTPHQLKKKD